MENKKIETIRVNQKLAEILENVPKGVSYANWIIDKLERLNVHEQNATCWVVSSNNVGSNRMSVGDQNGKSPIFDEVIYITTNIPKTNMSGDDRINGWLGQTGDYSDYAHGGFACVDAAKTFITEIMKGKTIDEDLLDPYEDIREQYTTAEFEEYYFVADWFDNDKPEVEGLTDQEIEELAEKEEQEANKQNIGILGDIIKYLKDLKNS